MGGLELSWTRRARGGWMWSDGSDLPLNEQSEAYLVSFTDGSTVLANWEVAAPNLTIPAGELAALTALAAHGTFEIRQRGDRATSVPLTIALP